MFRRKCPTFLFESGVQITILPKLIMLARLEEFGQLSSLKVFYSSWLMVLTDY